MIDSHEFKASLLIFLAEIYGVSDSPHGFMLDNGQSGLLGTINAVSAAQASAAPISGHSTLAAHANHVLFLLNLFAAYERGETPSADWAGSWSVQTVDDAAWDALRANLRTAYDTLVVRLHERDEWPPNAVGSAMMLLAHTAYHVGEIRQRLLWLGAG